MSAAYYLAFSAIAEQVRAGELDPETLVCTVDADGQHELAALDDLVRIACEQRFDAVLAQRDLSDYPAYKRLGNSLLSKWATFWARSPLLDVEAAVLPGLQVQRDG